MGVERSLDVVCSLHTDQRAPQSARTSKSCPHASSQGSKTHRRPKLSKYTHWVLLLDLLSAATSAALSVVFGIRGDHGPHNGHFLEVAYMLCQSHPACDQSQLTGEFVQGQTKVPKSQPESSLLLFCCLGT